MQRDFQTTLALHRLGSVHDEVEQHLINLSPPDGHAWDVAVQLQREREAAEKFLAQERHGFFHRAAEVHHAGRFILGARVAEHRADDVLALQDGLLDVRDVFLQVRVALRGASDEFVRHADHGEQVVEVMRDACGQRAERLHFLGAQQFHARRLQRLVALRRMGLGEEEAFNRQAVPA